MTTLPPQLQKPDYRFIRIDTKSKDHFGSFRGLEPQWNTTANYKFDDPTFVEHLKNGGNYGVLSVHGLLLIIDCDDAEVVDRVELSGLGETFTVESGSGGRHYYFELWEQAPWLYSKPIINDKNENIGHITWVKQNSTEPARFVVGPGSIHPNGKPYFVLKDLSIKKIDEEDVQRMFWDLFEEKKEEVTRSAGILELRLEDVMDKSGLHKEGNRWQGPNQYDPHPEGRELSVDFRKGVWHCFSHDSGGGAWMWLGLREGKITCSQARPGRLNGFIFVELMKTAQTKYGWKGVIKEETFQQQQADKLFNPKPHSFDEFDAISRVERKFLCGNYIPEQSMILVGGRPKSLKSFAMLDMMMAISSGRKWLGEYQTVPSGILWIDEENGQHETAKRAMLMSKQGENYTCIRWLSMESLLLNVPERLEWFRNYLTEHKEIRIVVLDSFRRICSLDENNSQEVNAFLNEQLKPLITQLGISIMIIIHFRKKDKRAAVDMVDMDDIRGSGDLSAMADSILLFRRSSENKLEITHESRVSEQTPMQNVELLLTKDENNKTTHAEFISVRAAVAEAKAENAILERILTWLEGQQDKSAQRQDIVKILNQQGIRDRSTIDAALKNGRASKQLKTHGKGIYVKQYCSECHECKPLHEKDGFLFCQKDDPLATLKDFSDEKKPMKEAKTDECPRCHQPSPRADHVCSDLNGDE